MGEATTSLILDLYLEKVIPNENSLQFTHVSIYTNSVKHTHENPDKQSYYNIIYHVC